PTTCGSSGPWRGERLTLTAISTSSSKWTTDAACSISSNSAKTWKRCCSAKSTSSPIRASVHTSSRESMPKLSSYEGRSNLSPARSRLHSARRELYSSRKGELLFRPRSEEHTSELQSRVDLVCRLLLEKKKRKI